MAMTNYLRASWSVDDLLETLEKKWRRLLKEYQSDAIEIPSLPRILLSSSVQWNVI